MSLVKELGRQMAEVNKEPRSTMFMRQRLSVAVQRGTLHVFYEHYVKWSAVPINYIYFHFNSLFNANKLCRSSVPMSSIEVIIIIIIIIFLF